MKLFKYTLEELKDAVANSTSVRQALDKLGVIPAGGNYRTFKKAIKEFSIDISHFTGKGWNKGRKFQPKRPIEDYLSNGHTIQSHKLRLRLLKEGVFQHICSSCQLTTWNNKPIPLELDHKNGQHIDNTLSNLRLLCPNCHAQTSTYRGKNKKHS